MRKLKFLWTLLALPFLASCSEDVPEPGNEPGSEAGRDGVYMSIVLNPTNVGGRSTTSGDNESSDGTEVGTDEENALKTALIILTDRDNKLIATAMVPGKDNKGSISTGTIAGQPVYQTVAKFDKTKLATYYDGGGTGEINVFVICNPTSTLEQYFETDHAGSSDWANLTWDSSKNDGGLWNKEKGFTMSNVYIEPRNLPANINEWTKYDTQTKAFDLSGMNAPGTEGAVDNLTGKGAVKVHRMAARFDFRDGSQMEVEGGNGLKGTPFTYEVVHNAETGETIVNCEIIGMTLTNMSLTEYYLGRVSDDGLLNGANYALCGPEKAWFNGAGGNYVVSTNAQEKFTVIKNNFSTYFKYPFFGTNGQVAVETVGHGWEWVSPSSIVKSGNEDNKDKEYYFWRYLTENTIPRPNSIQTNSQSTGVLFKTRMLGTSHLNDEGSDQWEHLLYEALAYDAANVGTGKLLHNNPDLDPILYSLSGTSLYVTWENVRMAALDDAGFNDTETAEWNIKNLDRNSSFYRTVYGSGGVGTIKYTRRYRDFENGTSGDVVDKTEVVTLVDTLAEDQTSANYLWQKWEDERQKNPTSTPATNARTAFKIKATGLGFNLYQSSQDPTTGKWGYYCYYYYWNRHNDNGRPGIMGPMEFAVVRNNIYKLAVTRLSTLGHPGIPENDPNDPKPDTPDESSEVYLTVSVDVIPWVVRVNHIEF